MSRSVVVQSDPRASLESTSSIRNGHSERVLRRPIPGRVTSILTCGIGREWIRLDACRRGTSPPT